MASIEQKNLTDEMATKAAAFLSERAEGFEEIRIAVAGFEGLRKTSPKFAEWTEVVLADRNPDGTFGKGPARGKATGERVAALLRMGADIEHRDTVVAAMKEGQRPDGGWSKDDGPSDLGTSYRVMRAFYMLKEAPDLAAIRKFIASCRKSDGGYSATPDGAADPSGCYYATIILGWARTLAGEPAHPRDRRVRPPLQRQGPGRLGGRHEALVGPRRDARGDLARPEAERLPRDRPRAMATSS